MIRQIDRYKSGKPLMMTAAHAGSTGSSAPNRGSKRLHARQIPLTIVIGTPANKSLILFTIMFCNRSAMYQELSSYAIPPFVRLFLDR